MAQNSKMIFIVGIPRSGTTWLWGLFESHPNVVPLLKSDFGNYLSQDSAGNYLHTETNCFATYSRKIIERIIKEKQEDNPGKFILEKTPLHLLHLDKLSRIYPDASIIYVQRNPIATINSMLKTDFYNFADNLDDAINKYKTYYSYYNVYKKLKNIMTVRYEDLQADTRGTMLDLYSKVGLSTILIDEIIEKNHNRKITLNNFRRGQVDSYKKELSKKEQQLIKDKLFYIMKKWRYYVYN